MINVTVDYDRSVVEVVNDGPMPIVVSREPYFRATLEPGAAFVLLIGTTLLEQLEGA